MSVDPRYDFTSWDHLAEVKDRDAVTDNIDELTAEISEITEDLAASLLESHRETGIDLSKWSEAFRLVRMVFPQVAITGEGSFELPDVDVYRLEAACISTPDIRLVKIGEDRAMKAVAKLLKEDDVSYVTVVREESN